MNYFEVYRDIWEFHKRYCNERITEDSLEEAIIESKEIYKKHNKSKFVLDLLVAVINEIDRVYKEIGADANLCGSCHKKIHNYYNRKRDKESSSTQTGNIIKRTL